MYEGKRITKKKNKRFIFLLVLLCFILTPLFVYADSDAENIEKFPHGKLTVSANDVSFCVGTEDITAKQVIHKASPSALHNYDEFEVVDKPVDATYAISDEDMTKINDASGTCGKVTITIRAEYLYFCPSCRFEIPVESSTDIEVSFVPKTYKVTFDGNGGKIDGKKVKIIDLESTGKGDVMVGVGNMPDNVKREGYSLKGWSKSATSYDSFTKSTKITKDLTVYAWWIKEKKVEKEKKDKNIVTKKENRKTPLGLTDDPLPDEPVEKETPTKTRYNLILGSNDAVPANSAVEEPVGKLRTSENITKAEFVSLATHQDVPVATIGDGRVPLFAPDGFSGWALINLIFAAMGILMALLCILISFKQERQKQSLWFILSIASGVAGLVFFFMTQDLDLNMILVDNWTVINGILFVIATVSIIMYLRKKNTEDDFEEFIYDY